VGLRRYVGERFGVAAVSLTAEELAERTPPFALTTRWATLVTLLEQLDGLRFRDESDDAARALLEQALPDLLQRALSLVDDTTPPEARR
jgi:hypothetical protein